MAKRAVLISMVVGLAAASLSAASPASADVSVDATSTVMVILPGGAYRLCSPTNATTCTPWVAVPNWAAVWITAKAAAGSPPQITTAPCPASRTGSVVTVTAGTSQASVRVEGAFYPLPVYFIRPMPFGFGGPPISVGPFQSVVLEICSP